MRKQKKIIIWIKGIDDLIDEKGKVGGLTVQMYFWAQIFNKNDWKVFSFSEKKTKIIQNIQFLKFPTKRYVGIFIELIYSLFYILKIKPDVIYFRGAGRGLSYVSLYSKLTKCNFVFLGASDTDFKTGSELIQTKHDKILFRRGLNRVKYFITQNNFQQKLLKNNYNKNKSIIIPNIWINTLNEYSKPNSEFVLWVSNFRNLKRPKWFLNLAKSYSYEKFVMAGGSIDNVLYENCKNTAQSIHNLIFLGPKPFNTVNSLFEKAKIFVCTSEIEGFPNTFLQAWSYNIPVITTFDPSNLVKKKQLGIVVNNIEELYEAMNQLLNDAELYLRIQKNIQAYFNEAHSPQKAYEKVINFLSL